MSKPRPIEYAMRDDGRPVTKGDRVRLTLDNGTRLAGKVIEVGKAITFQHLYFAKLQTYTVRCTDGMKRPCHARHIKLAYSTGMQRKFKRVFQP